MQLLTLQNLARNGYIPHTVLTSNRFTSSEGCITSVIVITTFMN